MGIPENLQKTIEGAGFRVKMNMASGFRMFLDLVRQTDTFSQLKEFASSMSGCTRIAKRIKYLSTLDSDSRYENPHDTALAVYLLALYDMESSCTYSAATQCLVASRIWWADRVARGITDRWRG